MINVLDIDIDYDKLLSEYNKLNIDELLNNRFKQLAVQCRKDCPIDTQMYESCGSLFYDWPKYDANPTGSVPIREKIYKEEDFFENCEYIKNTYIQTVLEKLKENYNIVRGRFMLMQHKTCLTYHKDKTPRIHIPIYTNQNCMMIINDNVYRLDYGKTYLVNTTVKHTALNASKDNRVHLVFCTDMINI